MTQLWELGAKQLADAISAGETSSCEVVESFLNRIDKINPELNAITAVLGESATVAARRIDEQIANGETFPLGGVPVTVKENQDVAGSATTHGLAPLKNAIADTDSPHIAELLRAGAIPIARTNMPEFGMRWHTTNGLYGPTINPKDANLTPGGSSGGEAAAIASGMSPLGIGNDGAGSLRWPAQCCGIAALKPSHGRVPLSAGGTSSAPVPFAFQLLGVHGPMARKVEDLELAIGHMCSADSTDPWHHPAPLHQNEEGGPVTVGLVTGLAMSSDIENALGQAAEMLRDAGHVVEHVELPSLQRASEIYTQIMDRFGRLTPEPQRAPVGVISEEYDQFWAAFNEPWKSAAGKEAHDPMMERGMIYADWSKMMRRTPLIIAPIATRPPWPVGSDLDQKWLEDWLIALRSVVVVNLLGLPSVAVPVTADTALPQVVQIIGPRFREDLCLAAAKEIESRTGATFKTASDRVPN